MRVAALTQKVAEKLLELAETLDARMARYGVKFVECDTMREAAALIALLCEEIARERLTGLAHAEAAHAAIASAEARASAAENALAKAGIVEA